MTQTRTIGEILKTEREHHGIKLVDLAKKTRIKKQYLEALEKNQFNKLPASAYVRGYIKTYAQIFGFDHKPLLAILRRDYKESAKNSLVPREFIKPVLKRGKMWTPVTVTIFLLTSVFITMITYVAFQYYNLQKPPLLIVEKPIEDEVVASQMIVEGQSVSDAVVTVNAQAVRLDAEGNFSHEIFLPQEGLNTITIESTDRRGKSNVVQRTVRVEF